MVTADLSDLDTNLQPLWDLVHTVRDRCLLQAYAHKLGQCLLDITSRRDSNQAHIDLQRCTLETHALHLCLAMSNPKNFAKFHSQRLDGFSGAGNSDLSDAFYTEMLVR